MVISANLTSSLLGAASGNINPKVSDILTGKSSGGLAAAVSASLSGSLGSTSNLSSTQQGSFATLASFISENVSDEAVKTDLLSDLSAIQNILETGDSSASLDPVFSLLQGFQGLDTSNISANSAGLLLDSLV